jgi:hypothetical protein
MQRNPLESHRFKGTVSRDFLLLVFFMNQFPPSPRVSHFSKIRGDIRKSRCTTGVNDTGGKLPPVSTTPAANLPPVSLTPVANNENNIRLQTP